MSQTFKTNPLRKGSRCTVYGNHLRKGIVLGRFDSSYVVRLDKPYMFGRLHKTIISVVLVHPDNIARERK